MNKKKCVSDPEIEIVENDNERLLNDPDLLLDHLNDLVIQFCNKWNIDNTDIKPMQFTAVLDHLRLQFFKPNKYLLLVANYGTYKTDSNNNTVLNNTVCNRYNFEVVNNIYYIYTKLCNIYQQVISLGDFSTMIGIPEDTFHDWQSGFASGATSAQVLFYQKVKSDREKSLEKMLMDKSVNPIKPIAILNHRYGWNMPGVTKEVRESPALSTSQLPNLSLTGEQKPLLTDKSE